MKDFNLMSKNELIGEEKSLSARYEAFLKLSLIHI